MVRVLDDGRDGRAYVLGASPRPSGGSCAPSPPWPGSRCRGPCPRRRCGSRDPGPALAAAGGLPAALPGLLRALDGRTCYARDTARRELAHTSRSLEAGLRAALAPAPPTPG